MHATLDQDLPRELARREHDGLTVSLWWQGVARRVWVAVYDRRTGDAFDLDVGAARPLDVFEHPYAYAAARGVGYRDRPRAVDGAGAPAADELGFSQAA